MELAQKPGERLWLRFVEEAARTPLSASQLSERAQPALIAAVGLDPEKRYRVEQLLAKRSLAPGLSVAHQFDLIIAMGTLEDLEPTNARRGADFLLRLMERKDIEITNKLVVDCLVTFGKRLEPAEASRLMTQALEKEVDIIARRSLAEGLAAVACRLEPAEAARVLILALEKEQDYDVRKSLLQGLRTASYRLEPEGAARRIEPAARELTQALEKEKEANALQGRPQDLAPVAPRPNPTEVARELTVALEKKQASYTRKQLAEKLAAVAGGLTPAEAARVAERAARVPTLALQKEQDGNDRRNLAEGLAAVAGRLEPAETVHMLTQALEKERDSNARWQLAHGLATAAGRLPPAEAAEVCASAANTLENAAQGTTDLEDKRCLENAWAMMLQGMDPGRASTLSKKQSFQLSAARDANGPRPELDRLVFDCSENLDSFLTNASRPEISSRVSAVEAAVGLARNNPLATLPVLAAADEPLPCRLTTQDLVELLKMPTCFGKVRQVVLKHLGNRFGRRFDNHWEFVRYAKEHRLDLDFTSPPKRPSRP